MSSTIDSGYSGRVAMCADWHGIAPAKTVCEHFHIRAHWRVLIVEDTEDRISWFRQRLPNAFFATNAEAALQALSEQEFKVAFLDHDLHWMHADNTIFKGTGKEVARFMAQRDFKGIVIIHSRHEEGAVVMKKFLPNARLAPFGTFEIISEANS
jgi:CheY-like chemotaxis protein